MPISPIGIGDGRPWQNTFTVDGGKPFQLTGVPSNALSLHLVDTASSQLYICTGAWDITDAGSSTTPGIATFIPSVADLTTPTGPFARVATYNAYPVVTLSSGPVAMDAQILKVTNQR